MIGPSCPNPILIHLDGHKWDVYHFAVQYIDKENYFNNDYIINFTYSPHPRIAKFEPSKKTMFSQCSWTINYPQGALELSPLSHLYWSPKSPTNRHHSVCHHPTRCLHRARCRLWCPMPQVAPVSTSLTQMSTTTKKVSGFHISLCHCRLFRFYVL